MSGAARRPSVRRVGLRGGAHAVVAGSLLLIFCGGCKQDEQNIFGRRVQNWTGAKGVLEVYAGGR